MNAENKSGMKQKNRKRLIIKVILWLITTVLLVIGVLLYEKGTVSVVFLAGAVVTGIFTVVITFWWDGDIYKHEQRKDE